MEARTLDRQPNVQYAQNETGKNGGRWVWVVAGGSGWWQVGHIISQDNFVPRQEQSSMLNNNYLIGLRLRSNL